MAARRELARAILARLSSSPLALRPPAIAAMLDVLRFHAGDSPGAAAFAAGGLSLPPPAAAAAGRVTAAGPGGSAVAVLPLRGVIVPRADAEIAEWFGLAPLDRFRARLRESLADPAIGAVVLAVDSPGGLVGGVPEAAAEILAARGVKPIVAVADGDMQSAAYWLASAADTIVASPSSELGSIGVWMLHLDFSEFLKAEGVAPTLIQFGRNKTEGNPFQPLGEEARASLQAGVDDFGALFVKAVAKGRGVTPAAAGGERFGEGRSFRAAEALARGLADRVETLEDAVRRLLGQAGERRSPRRAAAFERAAAFS